jgi:hypothetical protein
MHRLAKISSCVVAVFLSFAFTASIAADDPKVAKEWRIECDGGAHSDGKIEFRVTPKDEPPMQVTVAIKNGRGENGVARDIRDAFRAQLDPKRFHSETDDGEDVLVKRKSHQPNFNLELVSSTVEHVKMKVDVE